MSSWRLFPSPKSTGAQQYSSSDVFQPVIAVPFQRRNSLWQQVPGTEVYFSVVAAALASGGAMNIWQAGAGNTILLTHLSLSSSVAGRIDIQYAGVQIWTNLVLAGATVLLPIAGSGAFMPSAAGLLRLIQVTGGPADVRASAWGAEVLF